MGNLKKLFACTATVAVTLSTLSVAGCGQKTRSNPKVEADSDWYNVTKYSLESNIDMSGTQYSQVNVLGEAGGCYVVWCRAQYPIPYDVDPENTDYKDYSVIQIESYNTDGERMCSVDLYEAIDSSGLLDEAAEEISNPGSAPRYYTWDPKISDDMLTVDVEVLGDADSVSICYKLFIDPATGDVDYERSASVRAIPPGTEGTALLLNVGEYQINDYYAYDESGMIYSVVGITDGSGEQTLFDLSEKLPNDSFGGIIGFLDMGDGKLLCSAVGEDIYGPCVYYTFDTVTGSVTKAGDDEYAWLASTEFNTCSYFEGIGNVVLDTHSISKIDFENSTITEVLNFDDCNINRADIPYMDIISYTGDELVLMGCVYGGSDLYAFEAPGVQLIKLTKADTNPNAGKTILTAAATGNITYAMSEAVCVFNETDPDYFIKFDPRYEIDQYTDISSIVYVPDSELRVLTADSYSRLTDQLTVDLIAGEGPDIIFDSSRLSQLNTDDYLVDLSGKISEEGLFGNIIEASKTDGKLYQLPIAFGVTGIVTKTENIAPGQVGFTFDQYATFVDEVCNGKDPIAMNQTEFFILCLASMNDLCYTEEGKIDYDTEVFRTLAEFTDENIFPAPESAYQDVMFLENAGGIYFQNGSFMSLLANLQSGINNASVLGIPSIDGRGPLASVGCSVAVSSQSPEQDGCLRFVETLLSPEIQEYYANDTGYTPVNEAAFDSIAEQFVNDYNARMAVYETSVSPAELSMMNIDTARIETDVIDSYKAMIGTISGVESTDVAVDMIIREEIPAYFFGQKTIDEVIPVLEDRVQTFLDERD